MVLGIDIDDVITETSLALVEHAKIHEREICEAGELLDHLPQVMRGEILSERVKMYFERFMAEIMANAHVKEGVPEILKQWQEQGHYLVYITARGEARFPHTTKMTADFLEREGLPYDEIVFDSFDKLGDCLAHKIDLMVDDSVKNCEDLEKGGIKTVVFTSPVNQDLETTLDRVDNWPALERYVDNLANHPGT